VLIDALAALAALSAAASTRAQSIEILSLRHRSAEDVLPLLQPFVEPGGALTGQGSQLFLRASAANAREIRRMLAALDRAPRQLQITVRQDRVEEQTQRTLGADGSVVISSSRGSVSGGSLGVEAGASRSTGTRSAGQMLRVVEGGRAVIEIGTAIPFTFKQYVPAAGSLTELPATSFYEAVTGFTVRPLLAGEVVTLELSPADATITARGIERAQLMTRVQGRLGEWIAVGGADLVEQARRGGIAASDARSAASQRGVWVKVEDVGAR